MKKILGVCLFLVCVSADAALISRLGGQAYYDTVLDITWAADAKQSPRSCVGLGCPLAKADIKTTVAGSPELKLGPKQLNAARR